MSIKSKIKSMLTLLGCVLIIMVAVTIVTGFMQSRYSTSASGSLRSVFLKFLPLTNRMHSLQVDVIQVQQFLQGAAATHHDKGFKDAKKYTVYFLAKLVESEP